MNASPRSATWLALALLAACAGSKSADRPDSLISPTDVASGDKTMAAPPAPTRIEYPAAPRADVSDLLHGVRVADPFRPLEQEDAAATRAWITAENRVTQGFLASIPSRPEIRARLERLWNYERFSLPVVEGGKAFYRRNDGLQPQDVLWVDEGGGAAPRVLIDPNTYSKDGTIALSGMAPSRDGKLVAYALSEAGSDWAEWRVREVATGKDLPDRLKWIKFTTPAWLPDGSGFYYGRFPEPPAGAVRTAQNYNHKLYFHRLGSEQSTDRLVHERPDRKEWEFSAEVTDDGRYLAVEVSRGTDPKNAFAFLDLSTPDAALTDLLSDWDAEYAFLGNEGPAFYFRTDLAAPRGKVIAIDVTKPGRPEWREVIAEGEDVLERVSRVGNRLYGVYLHDAHALVRTFDLEGKPQGEVALPDLGSVAGFRGRSTDADTYFAFQSFTTPPTIHRLEVATGAVTVYRKPLVDFDPTGYDTVQSFATSRDGTKVPVFVTARRGAPRDGSLRLILGGYGGFGNSVTPRFSVASLVWLERGGAVATACLRGGGEYGREWHLAGTKLRKQNVFDDFIAVAEHLVSSGWTASSRLAIQGGSNGGLLVGACMTQRPDLFGACLPAVGVMDMLRYHKFTVGWAWGSEYGTADDFEQFKALLEYSPLHNVRKGTTYPATLVTTGDHDDRVVPAHSLKFAAALQEAQAGTAPVLLRVETRAGHGAGKPTSKILEETADRWAFLDAVLSR